MREVRINSYEIVEEKDFLILHLDEQLEQNELNKPQYILRINYTGPLTENLSGLYKSKYKDGNQTK